MISRMTKLSKIVLFILALIMPVAGMCEDMPEVDDTPLRAVHIRAIGDIMMHQKQLDIAWVKGSTYDFHPAFELITDTLSAADYTMANLETTVGLYGRQSYSGYPRFNAPETFLEAVKDAGVDFLTLANNHMLDRYFDGMVITVDNVEDYGFDFSGAYRTKEESEKQCVVEINGIKIGVLCYTDHTNTMENHCDPAAIEYGIDYLAKADFAKDVKALEDAGAEIVIAMPHWGLEYKRKPSDSVRELADKMVAAGVDIIIGSHPHMVQPIEYVTSGGNTALVAWSLGNFVSDMKVQYTDSGIVLDFTIREDESGNITVQDVGYIPIYCWRQEYKIRAMRSGEYLEERPEGMADKTYGRLKASYNEITSLIGDNFKVLEK